MQPSLLEANTLLFVQKAPITTTMKIQTWHKNFSSWITFPSQCSIWLAFSQLSTTAETVVSKRTSPGLWILSSSLTDLADTTPPIWTKKPGGKVLIVKNGYSCKSFILLSNLHRKPQSTEGWNHPNNWRDSRFFSSKRLCAQKRQNNFF